jgi:hypothetical protein
VAETQIDSDIAELAADIEMALIEIEQAAGRLRSRLAELCRKANQEIKTEDNDHERHYQT